MFVLSRLSGGLVVSTNNRILPIYWYFWLETVRFLIHEWVQSRWQDERRKPVRRLISLRTHSTNWKSKNAPCAMSTTSLFRLSHAGSGELIPGVWNYDILDSTVIDEKLLGTWDEEGREDRFRVDFKDNFRCIMILSSIACMTAGESPSTTASSANSKSVT